MQFIILKVSHIHIPISVNQPPKAMSHVVLPVPLVHRAVRPLLHSTAIPLVVFPLPLIDVLLLELDRTQCLRLLHVKLRFIVDERPKMLFLLPHQVIGVIRHLVQLHPSGPEFLIVPGLVEFGGQD